MADHCASRSKPCVVITWHKHHLTDDAAPKQSGSPWGQSAPLPFIQFRLSRINANPAKTWNRRWQHCEWAARLCVAKPLIHQIDQCQWPVLCRHCRRRYQERDTSSRSDWWLARLARLGRSHRSDDPNQDDLEDQEDFEQSELQYFIEHFEQVE